MSAVDTNRALGGIAHVGFTSRLIAALQQWNDARVTRNVLNRLSDRELDDIGLNRSDIDRLALRG